MTNSTNHVGLGVSKRILSKKWTKTDNNMHEGSTITSAIGNRLYDHPRVQLELLEYCMNHTEIYNEYRDVIGLYFLWSYYLETLCFAAENKNAFLSLEYYVGMQKVCRTFFPDWRSNPLIRQVPDNIFHAFESIDIDLESQEDLNRLIISVSDSIR